MNDHAALAHVFWIGGSPCSGKSSVADMLAEKYDCRVYHCDEAFERHKTELPAMQMILAMTWDEIWMRPVDVLERDQFEIYRDEFGLILDDLLALSASRPIIAEGTALLPGTVAAVLADPRQAIWVIPTPEFQRQRYPLRGAWVSEILRQCADPDGAFHNWMERDIAFGRTVAAEAAGRGFRVVHIDGSFPIEETAAMVEDHFQLGR